MEIMTKKELKKRLVEPKKDSISQFEPFYQLTPNELKELNEQYHQEKVKYSLADAHNGTCHTCNESKELKHCDDCINTAYDMTRC